MAIPIIYNWQKHFEDYDEGLGSSYERVVLNNLLDRIVKKYYIKTVLEAPCFGFTGITGINSMNLAKNGLDITLMDSKGVRIRMIEEVWNRVGLSASLIHSADFNELPFPDNSFDLSWNFSAVWFVKDPDRFLKELVRVTKTAVLIIVPNTFGLGYILQKISSKRKNLCTEDIDHYNPEWIKRKVIVRKMIELGWKLKEHNLIDCPPWPDIGMKKEDFLRMLGLGLLLDNDRLFHKKTGKEDVTRKRAIIEYYAENDKEFPDRMMKYYWFERIAPYFIKLFWAHHHYYLLIKEEPESS